MRKHHHPSQSQEEEIEEQQPPPPSPQQQQQNEEMEVETKIQEDSQPQTLLPQQVEEKSQDLEVIRIEQPEHSNTSPHLNIIQSNEKENIPEQPLPSSNEEFLKMEEIGEIKHESISTQSFSSEKSNDNVEKENIKQTN